MHHPPPITHTHQSTYDQPPANQCQPLITRHPLPIPHHQPPTTYDLPRSRALPTTNHHQPTTSHCLPFTTHTHFRRLLSVARNPQPNHAPPHYNNRKSRNHLHGHANSRSHITIDQNRRGEICAKLPLLTQSEPRSSSFESNLLRGNFFTDLEFRQMAKCRSQFQF